MIATNQKRKGYKQTEIGLIPDDWQVKKIEEFCICYSGGTPNTSNPSFYGGSIPWITSSDLNSKRVKDVSGRITQIGFDSSSAKFVDPGTILFALYGATAGVVAISEIKATINQAVLAMVLVKGDAEFLFQKLNYLKNFIIKTYTQGGQPNLSGEIIKALKISLPQKSEEQAAIAGILSDTDKVIEGLDKLLNKKRALKQGVMQELLTGRRRLPGFSGKWDIKKLGALLDYEQPTKYLVKDTDYDDNLSTPVLTAGKTFILGYTSEEEGIFSKLPVIIFDDFTTANKFVDFPFKAKSSAMKMLIPRSEDVNLRFVFEKMQLIDFKLGDHKRYWISEYQHQEIEMPKADEQTAITSVLSDMDDEIKALEEKLAKYRQVKLGMMQQLLTGNIRLI